MSVGVHTRADLRVLLVEVDLATAAAARDRALDLAVAAAHRYGPRGHRVGVRRLRRAHVEPAQAQRRLVVAGLPRVVRVERGAVRFVLLGAALRRRLSARAQTGARSGLVCYTTTKISTSSHYQ